MSYCGVLARLFVARAMLGLNRAWSVRLAGRLLQSCAPYINGHELSAEVLAERLQGKRKWPHA